MCWWCSQATELIEALKGTQQCFACAHGRPTCVPLVDLRALRQALQLLQLQDARDATCVPATALRRKLLHDVATPLG